MTAPATVVLVPGFADTSRSWLGLLEPGPGRRPPVEVVDLPGIGLPASLPPSGFDEVVEHVRARVEADAADADVVLVGHSLGAAIATRVAGLLPDRVRGLLSLEGNLTTDDGYFSAAAAGHPDPGSYRRWLVDLVGGLVDRHEAPRSYLESVEQADPATLWTLGRDAAELGADDAFGAAFRSLPIPTRYLWSARSTPIRTQRYLADHGIDHRRNDAATHWPLDRAAAWLDDEIGSFLSGCRG